MSNFCRAASKLLCEISWHTNVILGPQDLQDRELDVRALTFSPVKIDMNLVKTGVFHQDLGS
jgi:hypothetical protein